jgi:hypothetical protein
MFSIGMRETFQSEIQVYEWDPEVFRSVLKFLYSDELHLPANLPFYNLTAMKQPCDGVALSTSTQFLWEVYRASKYFLADRMSTLLEHHILSHHLTIDTVIPHLLCAQSEHNHRIITAALTFCEQLFPLLIHQTQFSLFPRSLLSTFIQSPKLNLGTEGADVIMTSLLLWVQGQRDPPLTRVQREELFAEFFPILQARRSQQTNSSSLLSNNQTTTMSQTSTNNTPTTTTTTTNHHHHHHHHNNNNNTSTTSSSHHSAAINHTSLNQALRDRVRDNRNFYQNHSRISTNAISLS